MVSVIRETLDPEFLIHPNRSTNWCRLVVMRKDHTLGVQLSAAGEFSAFVHGNAAEFHQLKINGAPVDMALTAPTQATPRATALSAKSRREAAAKVFMECGCFHEKQLSSLPR